MMYYHTITTSPPSSIMKEFSELIVRVFGRVPRLVDFSFVVIAQNKGRVLGGALIREYRPDNARSIESLCVEEKSRNSGVGTGILDYIKHEFRDKPLFLHVECNYLQEKNVSWYTKRGFFVCDRVEGVEVCLATDKMEKQSIETLKPFKP